MSEKRVTAIICILIFLSALARVCTAETGTTAIKQLADAVDSERLRETIYNLQENFDLNPPHKPFRSRIYWRTSNSLDPSKDATDNAAEYIYQKFKSFGLQVGYGSFTVDSAYPMVMEPVTHNQRNVVAALTGKGSQKEKVYILCAHYDSANDPALEWDGSDWDVSQGHSIWKNVPAPGANDNASGVAAVIEAARILSQKPWNHTIKFIAFACEEYSLFGTGSDHYVRKAQEEGELIAGVINLDMIGYQKDPDNLEIRVAGPQEYLSLMDALVRTGKAYDIDLQINRQLEPMRGDDAPFRAEGYPAIRIAEMPGYAYTHTEDDTMDKLNMQSITQTTRLAVATLAELAGSVTANEESME
jgi:hypothetical protein